MANKVEWAYARCPICGQFYPYVKGGYKPETCNRFECLHKYLHPELSKKEGKQ